MQDLYMNNIYKYVYIIHYKDLYSTPSMLLRNTPNSSTTEKDFLGEHKGSQ